MARDSLARYEADGWRLTVRHDGFTGQVACQLQSADRRMRYQPGAIGFVSGQRDTIHAWYRLDGGAAYRWQDRYPALVAAGVMTDGPGLDDPTGGIVWLPEEDLRRVASVAIRTNPKRRVRTFALRGAATMIAAARRLGCWQA